MWIAFKDARFRFSRVVRFRSVARKVIMDLSLYMGWVFFFFFFFFFTQIPRFGISVCVNLNDENWSIQHYYRISI